MQNRTPESTVVLRLVVNNHPGVMSHVCGLFARRAYNLEAIACVPIASGAISRIWLQVGESDRLEQIVKQLEKLPDIQQVLIMEGEHPVFTGLAAFG
ncbi:MAG: acetolactate synthase small subunit [Desulfopila sp.]